MTAKPVDKVKMKIVFKPCFIRSTEQEGEIIVECKKLNFSCA
jgi:hypothetical protein